MCVCVCVCVYIYKLYIVIVKKTIGLKFVYRIYEGFHIILWEFSMYGYNYMSFRVYTVKLKYKANISET